MRLIEGFDFPRLLSIGCNLFWCGFGKKFNRGCVMGLVCDLIFYLLAGAPTPIHGASHPLKSDPQRQGKAVNDRKPPNDTNLERPKSFSQPKRRHSLAVCEPSGHSQVVLRFDRSDYSQLPSKPAIASVYPSAGRNTSNRCQTTRIA
jgi:hypothetical protein